MLGVQDLLRRVEPQAMYELRILYLKEQGKGTEVRYEYNRC